METSQLGKIELEYKQICSSSEVNIQDFSFSIHSCIHYGLAVTKLNCS